jgi:hypothetical protein
MRSHLPLHLTLLILPSFSLSWQTPEPSQCAFATANRPPHSYLIDITTPSCLDSHIPSRPSAWHPWTHKPYCISASDSPWCVFTDAAHGISVIAPPDEAADVLHPDTHLLRDEDGLLSLFAADKVLKPRSYEVREIPGKGKGAVATRRIAKGKVVLVDTVSVLAAVEYPADVLREEVQDLLRVAAAQLGEPGRVTGLAKQGVLRRNHRLEEQEGEEEEEEEENGEQEMSEMEDVMLTNSFGVTVGGKEYMGLFADLAVSVVRLSFSKLPSMANIPEEIQSCLQAKVGTTARL